MTESLEILPPSEMLPAKPAKPWDQQPLESDLWYSNFLIYRDLGQGRGLREAQGKRYGTPPKASPSGSWIKTSKQWRWPERAQAYDLHLTEKTSLAIQGSQDRALQKIQQHIEDAADMVGKVIHADDLKKVQPELAKILVLLGRGGAGNYLLKAAEVMNPKRDKEGVSGKLVMLEFTI